MSRIVDIRLVRDRDGVWRATSADAVPQVHPVRGCVDCPMRGSDHSWPTCGAVGGRELPESIVMTWSGTPEWCPLRTGPAVVLIAED